MSETSSKPRVRMRLHYDGEPTDGLRLVDALLVEGRYDEGPIDRKTAESALEALELLDLPWIFDEIVEGGERLAEQIHSQATRGLQEIVQNAQDQGAKRMRFAVRRRAGISELLIAHDGAPVHIRDVVSMAYPLLSGSRRDADKIGRFGIGLKTLNQFGDRLEVHCRPLPGFEIRGGRIRRTADAASIAGFWDADTRETLFILRLNQARFDEQFFRDWIDAWSSESLLFLPTLRDVSLINLKTHEPIVHRSLRKLKDEPVVLRFPRAVNARRAEFRDGSTRRWTVFRVQYPVPRELHRINKALGPSVELAIATSNASETHAIYAGLPLEEPSTLPFSIAAPFDINVDRTEVLDVRLNEWLLARLADLVIAAADETFRERPPDGWKWIPLSTEAGGKAQSWLRAQLTELCSRIRSTIVTQVRIPAADASPTKLSDLLIEAARLTPMFTPGELELLDRKRLTRKDRDGNVKRALPDGYRDRAARWRAVLGDLKGPRTLGVREALAALEWSNDEAPRRDGRWLVDLIGIALNEDLDRELFELPCLLVEGSASRQRPSAVAHRGRLLVTQLPKSGLAALLARAEQLDVAFRARSEAAGKVRGWLRERKLLYERVSDALVLDALSRADGESQVDLSREPELVRRLRNSFEQLPADERDRLGHGIGRNIVVAGFEYDSRGNRQPIRVSPIEAYVPYRIEKVDGWPTAAGKARGVRWIDDKYADLLRTGRDAAGPIKRQGALAFFRSLGCAVAPRLHAGLQPDPDPNAVLPVWLLTPLQLAELATLGKARTLLDDWDSADLAAVLKDITSERTVRDRRKRARALFQSLHRAWGQQYAGRDVATAASHYYSWNRYGEVSATWIGRLASEPWLSTRERKFTPRAPRELAILTDASFEIEGEQPDRYAYELEPGDADSPLVAAIGIEGKPSVETIIERLRALREAEQSGAELQQNWVDRCYQALSAYCPGGRHEADSDLSRAEWRSLFGTTVGRFGLIRNQGAWKSIPDVRRGAYLGPRIPWVEAPTRLWQHLDVPLTDATDCRRVLESLAEDNADDIAVEVLVLRHLSSLADERGSRRALRGVPLRTYTGWTTKGDEVYAIRNNSLAEEVGTHWPVWRLPIGVDAVMPLIIALGITVLKDDDFQPDVPSRDIAANDLQADFPTIVTHLKNYLVLHHPALHDSVPPERWQALQAASVALGSGWGVKVRARSRRSLRIQPRAHLFDTPVLFCALDDEEAGQYDAGGAAVAPYLAGAQARDEDQSVVALAWESAFRRRGDREDALDVDTPSSDEAGEEAIPNWLRGRTAKPKARRPKPKARVRPEKEPSRELVDLDEFDLSTMRGTIAGTHRIGKFLSPRSKGLASPKPPSASTHNPRSRRAGDRNYTDTDREDIGFALMQAYLEQAAGLNIDDIRSQPNVGADGRDESKDIWVELKAFGRDRDDTVRLERPEAKRAKEKGDRYWLVLVWNLERPRVPELLVVQNPLARLDVYLGNGIKLAGLDDVAERPERGT